MDPVIRRRVSRRRGSVELHLGPRPTGPVLGCTAPPTELPLTALAVSDLIPSALAAGARNGSPTLPERPNPSKVADGEAVEGPLE